MLKSIIFADLDGSFLDEHYGYCQIKPIVDQLNALGVQIIFCSSKTRGEIEFYRKATNVTAPFISENGAAIFIPQNCSASNSVFDETSNYRVIRLSESYMTLRNKLANVKEKVAEKIIGFGDMSVEEIAFDTGLPTNLARLAKRREHDEPFRIVDGDKLSILESIEKEGLTCVEGGRYFHLTGGANKGRAVNILIKLYFQMFGRLETFAIGDGPNDFPMLNVVDKPFFIKKGCSDSRLNVWMSILRYLTSN